MKVSKAELKERFVHIPKTGIYFARQKTYSGLSWDNTHGELALEGKRMPTVEEFRMALNYFRLSSNKGLKKFYSEIIEIREPLRACHLDAYFKETKSGLWLLTRNKTKAEKLETCLMEDKIPGINLDDWLSRKNVTSQGFPKPNISKGDLHYWHPTNDSVARFYAYSGWAGLDCGGDPSGRDPSLGVFAVADVS